MGGYLKKVLTNLKVNVTHFGTSFIAIQDLTNYIYLNTQFIFSKF